MTSRPAAAHEAHRRLATVLNWLALAALLALGVLAVPGPDAAGVPPDTAAATRAP